MEGEEGKIDPERAERQRIISAGDASRRVEIHGHQWKPAYFVLVGMVVIPPAVMCAVVDGSDMTFYHVYGSLVSLFCCAYVLLSYMSMRQKGRNPNYVSSAPVILLLSSVACDAIFSVVTIVDVLQPDSKDCAVYSLITQFVMLGSVLYVVFLSIDLLMTVQFSFMNLNSLVPIYHGVALGISGISALGLIASEKYGNSIFRRCWVQSTKDDNINKYNWYMINIPFIVCFVITCITLLVVYYRLEGAKAKRSSRSLQFDNKLVDELNAILKSQSIQAVVICSFYIIVAIIYASLYWKNGTFPINAELKFLASFLSMKAVPNVIVWQMRMPPRSDDNCLTIEEYTIEKLAETRRLDTIQTCSACIRETAEMSAGPAFSPERKAKSYDFESVLLLNVRGAKSGVQFRFKSYAMRVFRHIREVSGISTKAYSSAFSPGRNMREKLSEGKSGGFLYFTEDGQYVVKTISQEEKNSLIKMLPYYYDHIIKNKNSRLVKYFGVHAMSMYGPTTYLVVMNNVLPSSRVRKYDLKGSIAGRSLSVESDLGIVSRRVWSSGKDRMKKSQNTKKDAEFLDNKEKIILAHGEADRFRDSLQQDVKFLKERGVMDYSLLVGIVDYGTPNPVRRGAGSCAIERISVSSMVSIDVGTRDNPRVPAGIIDILQEYNYRKKLEHFLKTRILRWDASAISCVDPDTYSTRFLSFIQAHIQTISSQ